MTTTLTCPYGQRGSLNRFFSGSGTPSTITLPDSIKNVSQIDFTDMRQASGALVTFRNATKHFNENFRVIIYVHNYNTIFTKTVSVSTIGGGTNSRQVSTLGVINLNNATVKYIAFMVVTMNANILFTVDRASEYKIVVPSRMAVGSQIYASGVDLDWTEPGSYRIVRRIANSYRNIADTPML